MSRFRVQPFHIADNLTYAEARITRHYPMAFNLLTGKTQVQTGEWVLVMAPPRAWQLLRSSSENVRASDRAAGADDRVSLY
jgi:hypothetical protein